MEAKERAIEAQQQKLVLFAEQQQLQLQPPHRYPATPAPGTYGWSPSFQAMLPPPPPPPFFSQGGQHQLYQYHQLQHSQAAQQQQQQQHLTRHGVGGLHTPLGSPQLPAPLGSYMGTTGATTTTTPNRQPSEADLSAECRRFVPTPAALSAVGNVLFCHSVVVDVS